MIIAGSGMLAYYNMERDKKKEGVEKKEPDLCFFFLKKKGGR